VAFSVRRVDYFYTTVGEGAYRLLGDLAGLGVNLLALHTVPIGPDRTQLTLFPEDSRHFVAAAEQAQMKLDGPHAALLVQGDDQMGALAGVHARLREADVSVFASMCVTDGRGGYGYVIYVRPEHAARAARALAV
jgi:hypothetical protein